MRKILYSPGFGAGWSSWSSGEVAKYMLTYQPIIDYLEAGGDFKNNKTNDKGLSNHPILRKMQEEIKELFGEGYVCVLGADDLAVAEVDGPVRINEYDGSESYEEPDDYEWM